MPSHGQTHWNAGEGGWEAALSPDPAIPCKHIVPLCHVGRKRAHPFMM